MRRSIWRTRATTVGSLASALALTLTGAPAGAVAGPVAGPVEGAAAGPSALAAAVPSFDELPAGSECPAGTSRAYTWYSNSFEWMPGSSDDNSGWNVVRGQARTGSYSARSVISAGDTATQPPATTPYWAMPTYTNGPVSGGRTVLRFAIKGDAPAGAAQITVNDTTSRITPTSSWRVVTWDVTDAVRAQGRPSYKLLRARFANYPSTPATNSTIDIDDVDIYTCTAQSKVRGDFDGDGIADVVTDRELSFVVWPGTGDLRLQTPRAVGQGGGASNWLGSPGDLNGDGRADIMMRGDGGSLNAYYSDGGGGFPFEPKLVGTGWQYMSSIVPIGDINQDGLSDVVAMDSRTGLLRRYWFTGPGSALTGGTTIGSGFNSFKHLLTIGDYNGDGRWDVVGILPNGDMRVYPTLANGNLYGHGTRIGTGWFFTHVSSPGDFNRDGHPDVLALDSTGRLFTYPTLGQGKWGTRVLTGTYFNQFQAIS